MKRMLFVFTVLAYGCGDDNPGTPANNPDAMGSDAQMPDAPFAPVAAAASEGAR